MTDTSFKAEELDALRARNEHLNFKEGLEGFDNMLNLVLKWFLVISAIVCGVVIVCILPNFMHHIGKSVGAFYVGFWSAANSIVPGSCE